MYIQNKKSVTLAAAIASVLALGSTNAMAYDAGDMIIRGGLASVMPNEESSGISVNGTKMAGTSDVKVDDNTQVGVSFTYMMSPSFGIEVLAATPFSHDITAVVGTAKIDAGSTKHLPPTISAQYYPLGKGSAFQPYVGAGLNITVFFDEDVDGNLETALSETGGKLSLDESVGLALQAGFDYSLNENWGVNAAVWYIDISTDAEFKFDSGNKVTSTVDIDPTVLMLGASYRF